MLFCYIFPLHLYLEVWSGWQRGPLYFDHEEESDSYVYGGAGRSMTRSALEVKAEPCYPASGFPVLLTFYSHWWPWVLMVAGSSLRPRL